jgi:3'-phosphoadenosine 5'-phosphosulfate sulfotransferase (PAPS reductase)/FAD synthetase
MNVEDGDTIAVWFSCGAASAVAAKLTLNKFGDRCDVRVVNSPVAEEDADNRRFLLDVQHWLGIKIEIATNPKYPQASCVDVWEDRKFMSSPYGAPCTQILKKQARYAWQDVNKPQWHVLGFTADEQNRFDRFTLTETENALPVLIDAKMSKRDCFAALKAADIKLPAIYDAGYPNANCIGCVKASSPTYWNHVRQQHPEVFDQRARQSRRLGTKLVRVKNQRIYLDELNPSARGAPLKSMDIECGLFCEERTAPI